MNACLRSRRQHGSNTRPITVANCRPSPHNPRPSTNLPRHEPTLAQAAVRGDVITLVSSHTSQRSIVPRADEHKQDLPNSRASFHPVTPHAPGQALIRSAAYKIWVKSALSRLMCYGAVAWTYPRHSIGGRGSHRRSHHEHSAFFVKPRHTPAVGDGWGSWEVPSWPPRLPMEVLGEAEVLCK